LGIVEFRIAVGGIPAESTVSAERPQDPQNRATKTPFALALALALYKARGDTKFSLREQCWKRLRENLQKLQRQEKNGKLAPWVQDFCGSITELKALFDFGHADFLYVKTGALGRGDILIEVAGKDAEAPDPIVLLEQKLAGARHPIPPDRRSANDIEPDESLRERLILIAKQGLRISGLAPEQELVLGHAILVCKLQELHESASWCVRTLSALKDDVLGQRGDRVELAETYADWHTAFERLRCLHCYSEDGQMIAFVDAVRDVGAELIALLGKSELLDQESASSLVGPVTTAVEKAIELGNPVLANLGVEVDARRQRLKQYVG